MTNAERYAQKLQSDYGIVQAVIKLDDKIYDAVDKVAIEVLPADKYQQWRKDYAAHNKALREKIGIEGLWVA